MCENCIKARALRSWPKDWNKMPEWQQKQYTKLHLNWKPSIWTYEVPLPCGYCLECRLNKAKQWAIKCAAESKMHTESCFVTFTYNDKHLPHTAEGLNTIYLRDLQLFFKKLLKKYPNKHIRRFYSAEYGYSGTRAANGGNPHYHAIIFGYEPKDLVFWKYDKKTKCNHYKSKELFNMWGKGMVVVGKVTIESAGYVARYTIKKAGLKPEKCHKYPNPKFNPWYERTDKKNRGINKYIKIKCIKQYNGINDLREPERTNSSRRPGIGHPFWEANIELLKKQQCFYIKSQGKVKTLPLAKSWEEKWKKENTEDYWEYWWEKQKRFEKFKQDELNAHQGLSWEEIQQQRYERLRIRTLALKRQEEFYTQEF